MNHIFIERYRNSKDADEDDGLNHLYPENEKSEDEITEEISEEKEKENVD